MKLKKIAGILFVLVLMVTCLPAFNAEAQTVTTASSDYTSGSTNEILNEQVQKSGANALSSSTPETAKNSLNSLGIKSGDVNSLARFTPANIFKTVVASLKKAAQAPVKAVATLLGILLACALLSTLKNSYGEKSLQNVFDIVSSLCIATVIILPVSQCVSLCAQTIHQSSDFMLTFLPVYSSLAVVSGHPASAIAFQSLLLVASEALSRISSTTFVPMVDMYLGFCVVGAVSPGINISGISGFVKSMVTWALGLCMTIYTGILAVQGLISNAEDNVTMKTAKFVVEGAVPVIGGAISDAMNTVISCTGLLKTAVGAYAIVVFILAFLPPVLECLVWLLAADLSLAAADVLGIANMSGLLKAIREALRLLLALVLVSALAMIISVSVMLLVGMGN
jgi:stage III sporulation protein AE